MNPEIAKVSLYLGAAISTALVSISAGFGQGHTAAHTAEALGRQPGSQDILVRSMLISQAVTESGAIFGLVVSFLLMFGGLANAEVDWARSASLLAAGLAMGLGGMGPNFGSGVAGAEACEGIGRTPSQSTPITINMLIGQALAQTSAIFALFVALILLYTLPAMQGDQSVGYQIYKSCMYIGAGLSVGIGTFGAGLGVGLLTGMSCKMIAGHAQNAALFMRTMFLGSAVSSTPSIFALVISILLIFV